MLKRKITETIEEYDSNGKIKKKTITITEEDDDNLYYPQINPPIINPTTPYQPYKIWTMTNTSVTKNEGE